MPPTYKLLLLAIYSIAGVHCELKSSVRNEEDLSFLLKGVVHIYFSGAIGCLVTFGGNAFPVVAGQTSTTSGVYRTLIAAGHYGAGKIVAAPHDSFIGNWNQHMENDRGQFLLNIINWLSPGQRATTIASVGTLASDLKALLDSNGIQSTTIQFADLNRTSITSQYDVLINKVQLTTGVVPGLKEYLDSGGGLLLAQTAWAYYGCCPNAGHFGSEYPPNMISSKTGFVWSKSYSSYANTPQGTFNASKQYLSYVPLPDSLEYVKDFFDGKVEGGGKSWDQSISVVRDANDAVDPKDIWEDQTTYDCLKYIINPLEQPVPTSTNRTTDQNDKLKLQAFHLCALLARPNDVQAHPASKIFPGEIGNVSLPSTKLSHAITLEIKASSQDATEPLIVNYDGPFYNGLFSKISPSTGPLDLENGIFNMTLPEKRVQWASTGVFATAGEVIQVTIETTEIYGFVLQIGCHTDNIANLAAYSRVPWATFKRVIANNSIEMASPYGGLLYIVIPTGTIDRTVAVTIKGGVKTPFYELGKTSTADWLNTVRYEKAPWAEFSNGKLIISVPTANARTVEDPEKLMAFWESSLDAMAYLAGIDQERPYYGERFVSDVQISAGYMHAGYPIMSLVDMGQVSVNYTSLMASGSWGHFHELGHNHQNGDWTFSGTGETTCNIFTLYVFDTVLGIPFGQARHHLLPETYRPLVQSYIVNGRNFSTWQSSPDFSLVFYVQIQRTYGWDIYKTVFKNYQLLTPGERPKNDQQKMNLWCKMLSLYTQSSLFDFFKSWGFPLSETVRDELNTMGLAEAPLRLDDLLLD